MNHLGIAVEVTLSDGSVSYYASIIAGKPLPTVVVTMTDPRVHQTLEQAHKTMQIIRNCPTATRARLSIVSARQVNIYASAIRK